MDITEKIIMLLNEKGISIAKMMRELGFSSGLFSQWKSGKQRPSAEKICKIAEYLNVSTDYLLGKTLKVSYVLTENEKFLLDEYRKLNLQQQKELLEILSNIHN